MPSSQTSLPSTMPSPQIGEHVEIVCVKPESVSLYVEAVVWRSAWNMSIEYMPPLTSPNVAAWAGVSVTLPDAAPWTPPRSTARWPLMNTQTSSSPVKSNCGDTDES